MNQKTAAKLLIFIREIETEIDAIAGILDSMDAILDEAAGASCGRRGHCGQSGRCGQDAGAEAAAQEPERLPDVPDWRDGAARQEADDRLTRIRLTVAAHQGDGLSEIISAILADGIKPAELAGLLGVHQARISEALHGKARPGFVARFCEVLGEDGDSANCRTGWTGRTGRTNAGSKAEGK